ncbi:hypothetical protein [Tropicimonas sp. IMCC34011]|uniref:hypothetical protein n=1 Tax=Tropicimonas sp. IMCC34011 TaxID=2248759 RepID=UPI00130073D8|nr:hypothetical protein [Tropicimonas sp. IMCC34011]
MTDADRDWLEACRAEERAAVAAARESYRRECMASWEGRDTTNVYVTPDFPPALGGASR